MQRYLYDLSSYGASAGEIGRLMTLSCVPVLPNDSHEIDIIAAFRLSPLRRALAVDAKVELFNFFVPHRHVYDGQSGVLDWKEFLKSGFNNPATEMDLVPNANAYVEDLGYIPGDAGAATLNSFLHMVRGYAMIYNQYFRIPNVDDETTDLMDEDDYPTSADVRKYGKAVAHLPSLLNTGVADVTAQTYANFDTSGATATSIDIVQAAALYGQNIDRDWFAPRYRDTLQKVWDTMKQVNIDADQRPELLYKSEHWMSGYDVDGTDSASLGSYSGKSQSMIRHHMPSRYFKEHGMLWTMAVVRFPCIFHEEMHPHHTGIASEAHNYEKMAGDPVVVGTQPPHDVPGSDYGVVGNLGYMPFGQEFRAMPNNIHPDYQALQGYPFLSYSGLTVDEIAYVTPSAYDQAFQSTQLGHWNCIYKQNHDAKRVIPPASNSIYAGADNLVER